MTTIIKVINGRWLRIKTEKGLVANLQLIRKILAHLHTTQLGSISEPI